MPSKFRKRFGVYKLIVLVHTRWNFTTLISIDKKEHVILYTIINVYELIIKPLIPKKKNN